MPRISGSSLNHEPLRVVPEAPTPVSPNPITFPVRRWSALLLAMGCLFCLAGCGTNLDEVVFQTLAAAGRTYVDLVLTDAANDLADAREGDTGEDSGDKDDVDDADTGDGDGNGGAAGGGDGDGGDGGVTLDGAALFADNTCAGCHGEDGASGFAPDITGKTAAEVATGLELATHSAISLTEEEIAAIAQFLGGGADSGQTGDADAGEQLFTGNPCGACHCPDAGGGCALDAPSLVGKDLATLDAFLVGAADHPGGKFELTGDDLANLQAYLASLE